MKKEVKEMSPRVWEIHIDCLMQTDGELLHPAVMEWAGVDATDVKVTVNSVVLRISDLNDSGRTFDELADIIEECL